MRKSSWGKHMQDSLEEKKWKNMRELWTMEDIEIYQYEKRNDRDDIKKE